MREDEYKGILAEHWLEKGEDALESAVLELKGGHKEAAVNRCYYACFYAFSAVLTRAGRRFRKHAAVRAALNRDYVKKGIIPRELGRLYNMLFLNRERAEYQPLARFEYETIRRWIDEIRGFIDWCRKYVDIAEGNEGDGK